jgi:hypothetical protein
MELQICIMPHGFPDCQGFSKVKGLFSSFGVMKNA